MKVNPFFIMSFFSQLSISNNVFPIFDTFLLIIDKNAGILFLSDTKYVNKD